jgi:hypothetical protein
MGCDIPCKMQKVFKKFAKILGFKIKVSPCLDFFEGCLLARALDCSLISFAFDCIQGIITFLHLAIVISHWNFTTLKDWLSLNIKAFNLIHYSFHMLNNFR